MALLTPRQPWVLFPYQADRADLISLLKPTEARLAVGRGGSTGGLLGLAG